MNRWLKQLALAALALSLMSSCDSLGNLRRQPVQSDVVICPANAFIDVTQYEVIGPKDNADFPRFAIEEATKYPNLKQAYTLLYQCWNHYHPTVGQPYNVKGDLK